MSMTQIVEVRNKSAGPRLRPYRQPDRNQAAVIFFHMKMQGLSEAGIARDIGVSKNMVHWVIYGLRTSGRVSKGIATALGYSNWNELVVSIKGFAA